MVNQSRRFAIRPVVHYPSQVQVGKTYLMTVNLFSEKEFEWRFEEEEYSVYCQVDSEVFKVEPVDEPVIVLHRFGGSYGEAQFLVTPTTHPNTRHRAGVRHDVAQLLPTPHIPDTQHTVDAQQGIIRVLLINAWGVPIKALNLDPIEITEFADALPSITAVELNSGKDDSSGRESRDIDANNLSTGIVPQIPTSLTLIITALPVEYLAVREHLTELAEEAHPQGSIYERGVFVTDNQSWNVGIVEVGAGNAGAAVEVERAIAHFKPDVLLLIGIARGIKDVDVGDVVAATKVYGYEYGKLGDDGFTIGPTLGQATYAVIERAKSEAGKGEWLERIPHATSAKPRVFVTPIAVGENRESELFQSLRANYSDAVSVEMEGYGFLQAAFAYSNIQTLVIRGISELIEDKNAGDLVQGNEKDRQARASQNASAFAFEVLSKLEIESSKPTEPEERPTDPTQPNFFALDDSWVGRESLIQDLRDRIRDNCRLLMLLGITGIGKTALGERLSVEVIDWLDNDWSHYHQENFDNDQQRSDFISVAARWLEKWGELVTPEDRNDPDRLMNRTINYLCGNRYLIQMDSLENILRLNNEGSSDFKDKQWSKFFTRYLRVTSCQSRFILTSGEIIGSLEMSGSRSLNFWHTQPVKGLTGAEQLELFGRIGLDISDGSESRVRLGKIGQAYEGYPLALRVIAGEIKNRPFNGNVVAYWTRYGNEVQEVLDTLEEASRVDLDLEGAEDQGKLARSTKPLRRNVWSRLNQTLDRLKEDSTLSHDLLCYTSVYRQAVPEEFWLRHLDDLRTDLNTDEKRLALDILRDRQLVEELISNEQNTILIRQHNIIRSIALERLKQLETNFFTIEEDDLSDLVLEIKKLRESEESRARRTHYRATINWLTRYSPSEDTNLEKVRGVLQTCYHLNQLEKWQLMIRILLFQGNIVTNATLLDQLTRWGKYSEQIDLCTSSLGNLNQSTELIVLTFLSSAHYLLGNYQESLELQEQHLLLARELNDRQGEGNALGNLGNIYYSMRDYQRALRLLEQQLAITREIDDRQGEANALGNIGNVYHSTDNYQEALQVLQQQLKATQRISNRQGEANALGNIGNVYYSLEDYGQSLKFQRLQLSIARELDHSQGEANACNNIALSLVRLGQVEQALKSFNASFQIFREIGNFEMVIQTTQNTVCTYLMLSNRGMASQFCNQVIDFYEKVEVPSLKQVCNQLKTEITENDSDEVVRAIDINYFNVINTSNVNLHFLNRPLAESA